MSSGNQTKPASTTLTIDDDRLKKRTFTAKVRAITPLIASGTFS
ncbi:hypothetical protein [Paludibacterium paludis]|nr:hypothetical protein [Paludibacterium paludis]